MSLTDELAERASTWWAKLPPERRAMYERAGAALEESGIADRALRRGDLAPDFKLPDAGGMAVRLTATGARDRAEPSEVAAIAAGLAG